MKKRILFHFCFLTCLLSFTLGQPVDSIPKNIIPDSSIRSLRLFEDGDLIEITLRFDLSTYLREKTKKEYMKAEIVLHVNETDSISKKIRLKTRGDFRNKYCNFAPIELNFKNANLGFTDLNKISKIKLTTQCRTSQQDEAYIFKEYLAYKFFNVLTDTSFRVRLVKSTFIDSEKKRKPIIHYGFFIEPLELLAARTNTSEVKALSITQKNITPLTMDRFALFNYMIGNFDWSIPGQHNVKVLKSLTNLNIVTGIAVPYDFDWSGLVNAAYAIPAEEVGVATVRERLFMGICRSKEVFQKDLKIFEEKKEEFYRIINEFPYLKEKDKRYMIDYLDEFFVQIKGNNFIFYLQNTCKKL